MVKGVKAIFLWVQRGDYLCLWYLGMMSLNVITLYEY
jgi:hypothetical protein